MKKLLILFLLLPLVLCSCSEIDGVPEDTTDEVTTAADTTGKLEYEVCVDWANFIKLDGVSYIGDWEVTEVSPDKIGEKIGEVTCGVPTVYADSEGNIHNLEPEDGAAFGCPDGTEIFSVIGEENAVAAYVKGKYYLYTTED